MQLFLLIVHIAAKTTSFKFNIVYNNNKTFAPPFINAG